MLITLPRDKYHSKKNFQLPCLEESMLVEGVQTFFLEAGKQEKLVYLLILPAWSYLTLDYMRFPYGKLC
jgi:hypothetical protein